MKAAPVLTYHDISPDVIAFSTTRRGGYSQGAYGELNMNGWCGDEPEAVVANRLAVCRMLGLGTERLIIPHQTHGTTVLNVTEDLLASADKDRTTALEGIDAVMTGVRGVCIGVSTADCIPILLYDPINRACCAVHAGWRGTVERIAERAVRCMQERFGTDTNELRAVIGPGISADNFEVGDEVYDRFRNAGFDMERISRRYAKWHIDLWACNRMQLETAGVARSNIKITGPCTYSHTDEYFSARRLGTASGRIFTGIMMTDNNQ